MGKRTYLTHVALILGLAALVPQCACKPQSWSLPKLPIQQTPVFTAGQLPIDCAELTADPSIPKFLIRELCSPPPAEASSDAAAAEAVAVEAEDEEVAAETQGQEGAAAAKDEEGAVETQDQEGAAEAKDQDGAAEANEQADAVGAADQEEAENAAKEEPDAAEQPTARRLSSDGAQEPSQVIVPFFRVVIQKLISRDGKVPTKDFWAKAYQEAGAPKLARHPTFFEMVAGLQQAVESFRSEDSWWSVVRLIKELTSDKQWKRLEAVVAVAHGRDPVNLRKALGASKALKVALKSSIKEPECRAEGLNPDPEDCRKFIVCFRRLGRWKSKDTKCPKYTEFSPSRLRCVWAPLSDCVEQSDSDEDSDSDESSREVVERILKHGSGAFHVQ